MTILLSAALAVLAQGPAATVPASDAPYDVGYEELVAHRDIAAREAIESCEELAENDPARLINHGIALARTGDYEAARAAFTAAANARSSVGALLAGVQAGTKAASASKTVSLSVSLTWVNRPSTSASMARPTVWATLMVAIAC